MNEELDYAEMLEIPVSTVNVVKKRSLFPHKGKQDEDIKAQVVESVNERVGAYASAEDYTDPPVGEGIENRGDAIVLMCEAVAVCLLAVGIFVTNLLMPNSAINTFISSFEAQSTTVEQDYSALELTSVTSERCQAEVVLSGGIMKFTADTAVYPVCDGKVIAVTQSGGGYTVEIAHTSSFSSVITGLKDVYCVVGDDVKANIPFAYSDGSKEVSVSLFDGDNLISDYRLSGSMPVWNS